MKHCVKFLVMDVDGTLTDGKIYMGQDGEAMKAFNIKDGCGILLAKKKHNIIPIIITARESKILKNRCKELGITELHQGSKDKLKTLQGILSARNEAAQDRQNGQENQIEQDSQNGQNGQTESCGDVSLKDVAYIGDDLADMAVMREVKNAGGVILAPADAIEEIRAMADYVSPYRAGDGAVRDCIDNYLIRSMEGERQYHQHNSKSSATSGSSDMGSATSEVSNETPYPSAPLLLDCVKNEYEKERNRMQNLDTKASAFMTAIILILTLFVPIIPFNALQTVFIKGADWQKGVVCTLSIPLITALGLLALAFKNLYNGYKPRRIYRFEIQNAKDISLLKTQQNIMEKALCDHYCELIEENITVNNDKADKIAAGLKLASIGFLILAVIATILVTCIGK